MVFVNTYNIKYSNFKILYDLLISNFSKREGFFQILIYYNNDKFNLEIRNKNTSEVVFKDSFKITLNDYNYLMLMLNNNFINKHEISLPYFEPLSGEETNIYYRENNVLPLDYDKARVHVLRNDKFEVRTYYFTGLNEFSYIIQDKAMEKLNNRKKVYSILK